jgi:hypothetical protein
MGLWVAYEPKEFPIPSPEWYGRNERHTQHAKWGRNGRREGGGGSHSPPAALGTACPPRASRGRGTACSTPRRPLPAPEPEAGPRIGARAPSRRRAGPSAAPSIPVAAGWGAVRCWVAGWLTTGRRLRLRCHASRCFQVGVGGGFYVRLVLVLEKDAQERKLPPVFLFAWSQTALTFSNTIQ